MEVNKTYIKYRALAFVLERETASFYTTGIVSERPRFAWAVLICCGAPGGAIFRIMLQFHALFLRVGKPKRKTQNHEPTRF